MDNSSIPARRCRGYRAPALLAIVATGSLIMILGAPGLAAASGGIGTITEYALPNDVGIFAQLSRGHNVDGRRAVVCRD